MAAAPGAIARSVFSGGGGVSPGTPGAASAIDVYNARTYGAKGNGSENDQPILTSLANSTIPAGGGTLYLPPGVYLIANGSALTIPKHVTLWVAPGARIVTADLGAATLTINGPLIAPPGRIFNSVLGGGTVTVVFGSGRLGRILPQWWGAEADGVVADDAAIQAAINAAVGTHGVVEFPVGTYKVTTTLTIYNGTQLRGESGYAIANGYGADPLGSRINFRPATTLDLFSVAHTGAATGGFNFHISIEGLFLNGNSVLGGASTSRYGLALNAVIYGRFENLTITGFQAGIYCASTIDNRFVNILATGTVACVLYAGGVETTDVWSQCTFNGPTEGGGSPIGVQFLGSAIGIRFTDCLWEQINTYGIEIARECQNIQVVGGYCEDVPYTANANACMFRVGYTGVALVIENHLTVIGGKFAGRNAGTVGSFLDCDSSNGVQLIGVNASRFTNIIRTTANTRINSVVIAGFVGISWTTFATDGTKIAGVYPSGVVNAGAQHQNARINSLIANTIATESLVASSASVTNASAIGSGNGETKRGSTNTQGIGAAATVIYTLPGAGVGYGGIFYVHGNNNAGQGFFDIVLADDLVGTISVLHSTALNGAPPARTYTMPANGGQLKLAMASGLFSVTTAGTVLSYSP